jgi:hypothetical protein
MRIYPSLEKVRSVREFLMYIILDFCVALGVVVGGSIVGGIGAFLVSKPPLHFMATLSSDLKIWALVAAIGGTFDTITNIEKGFLDGTPGQILQQVLLILFALSGAHTGMIIIQWLTGESA